MCLNQNQIPNAVVGMFVIVLFSVVGCDTGPEEDLKRYDPTKEGKKHFIPLNKIYSTSGQRGLRYADYGIPDPRESDLTNGFPLHNGEPTAAVIYGKSMTEVYINTDEKIRQGKDSGGNPGENRSAWLCVYLGASHSSPSQWVVHSILVQNRVVRIIVKQFSGGFASHDTQDYYYWIPISTLQKGRYRIELSMEDGSARTIVKNMGSLSFR